MPKTRKVSNIVGRGALAQLYFIQHCGTEVPRPSVMLSRLKCVAPDIGLHASAQPTHNTFTASLVCIDTIYKKL